jgi:hypothetical protein
MNHEVNNTDLMPMANPEMQNTADLTANKPKNILSFQEFVAGGSSDTENLPVPAQQMDGPANPGMDLTFMDEPATQDTETETAPEETDADNTETESDSQNMDQAV